MTGPSPCRVCDRPPRWFALADGRGQYRHECKGGDEAVTAGPIPEPTARGQWDQWFGTGAPVWPCDMTPVVHPLGREEWPNAAVRCGEPHEPAGRF